MSKYKTPFTLQGTVRETAMDDRGRVKKICLETQEKAYRIKLPKLLRAGIQLEIGQSVAVYGHCSISFKKSECRQKFKALTIEASSDSSRMAAAVELPIRTPPSQRTAAKPPIKIKVCQKSNCRKRGGQKVWQALSAQLDAKDEASNILLEQTSCLGKCKQGPVVMVLPDKQKHTHVCPAQIPDLLEQYVAI